MNKPELLFHIAKQEGLEFVFTSGNALTYPMHTHVSVYTITVVRNGIVKLARKYSTCVYPAGSVYTVAPYEAHSPTYYNTFDIVSLCINKELFHELSQTCLMVKCLEYARILADKSLLSSDTVKRLLTGIDTIYESSSIMQKHPLLAPSIAENLEYQAEQVSASKNLSMSQFHFIRKFKNETGLTPHQYIVQHKIRKAKKLLTTEMSIADTAALAGFCDQSHLNRWFNRSIGITPHIYKSACFFLEG